jgi:Heparinase II/III-like protein
MENHFSIGFVKLLASLVGRTLLLASMLSVGAAPLEQSRHPVPSAHPRLLGTLAELRQLAKDRPQEYKRVSAVARAPEGDDYSKIISMALVAAIDGDGELAHQVQQRAMKFVNGPIRQGHLPFATDLALCGLAYDLCHEAWPEADRIKFHEYVNKTVDANVQSEPQVFHNGWYGYKHWGIGVACYAGYYENQRAPGILQALEEEFRTRAAPALELAGDGGGWAEGYYIHYWLYEWLFYCEVARRCEGVDYYALAPKFFRHRAIASMFEMYPGLEEYNSRRPVPMGDGGGRLFGGDRDKVLAARRILVNYFRDDPAHQAVHAFDESTPRSSVGGYAYKDFLWRDTTVPRGNLREFRLSHCSPGPGYVYARSSWDSDATYFFFKCGDRFTAHQHLDVGHFDIYKYAELAGDGGHYDEFGTAHDVNYHLRTIAHNTILVLDPEERWPAIRAGKVVVNDGGQHHNWPHHNGAVSDAQEWQRQKSLYDIADLLAFEDRGEYVYVAGDATRAYSPRKLERFARQIVYLRPNTFVIFDQVKSKKPEFKKTWLLQAMHAPSRNGDFLVITNGQGKLFLQTLLPARADVTLVSGKDLYRFGDQTFPPTRNTGPAPECRIEVCPTVPSAEDMFLHVLTTADAQTASVPEATVSVRGHGLEVTLGGTRLEFHTQAVGGQLTINGQQHRLADNVQAATN